jgi:hypothetical protein
MKPDRSNYEIWFIDWLDGKLTGPETDLLKSFLEENPDLKEELKDLELITLAPPESDFGFKEDLFRTTGELSDSQFDYLCISNLENDITPVQKTELGEMISNDEQRRKRFDQYQKIRLRPTAEVFRRKSSVKKLTIAQRYTRMAFIGLSAAAAILLLVISVFSGRKPKNIPENSIVQNVTIDTIYLQPQSPVLRIGETISMAAPKATSVVAASEKISSGDIALQNTADSVNIQVQVSAVNEPERYEPLAMVTVSTPSELTVTGSQNSFLIRTYRPKYVPDFFEDNRSNVDRFVARFFHKQIMRDTIMPERPVERFELASAGITGINKLLGWEMALHKNTDDKGEVKSYVFTSSLLKFNAPVKRTSGSL